MTDKARVYGLALYELAQEEGISKALLNELGEALAAKYGVRWLPSDFKKRNGYLRSIELSRQYGIYRQEYCGCGLPEAVDSEAQ